MSDNIYKEARLRASKDNDRLKTLESAHDELHITKEKLGQIEQTDPNRKSTSPNPDDVVTMAKVYNAPELCYYYCSNMTNQTTIVLDCNEQKSGCQTLGTATALLCKLAEITHYSIQ